MIGVIGVYGAHSVFEFCSSLFNATIPSLALRRPTLSNAALAFCPGTTHPLLSCSATTTTLSYPSLHGPCSTVPVKSNGPCKLVLGLKKRNGCYVVLFLNQLQEVSCWCAGAGAGAAGSLVYHRR